MSLILWGEVMKSKEDVPKKTVKVKITDTVNANPLKQPGLLQGIMKSVDSSHLSDSEANRTYEKQKEVVLKLVKRIIEKKDGDLEIKRGLLFYLLEPFTLGKGEVVFEALKRADEKLVMDLIDMAGPNAPTNDEIVSYANFAQNLGIENAFCALLSVNPDKTMLIAMKAKGVSEGIKDAFAFLESRENPGMDVSQLTYFLVWGLLRPVDNYPNPVHSENFESVVEDFLRGSK